MAMRLRVSSAVIHPESHGIRSGEYPWGSLRIFFLLFTKITNLSLVVSQTHVCSQLSHPVRCTWARSWASSPPGHVTHQIELRRGVYMVKHAAGVFLFVRPRSQSARFDQVCRESGTPNTFVLRQGSSDVCANQHSY